MSRELTAALIGAGPHAALGEYAKVFDRVTGAWDCDYVHFTEDSAVVERYSGNVTFGWVLDGWAVQDVWAWNAPEGEATRRVAGTTIRFLDRETGIWTVYWFMPEKAIVITLKGGAVGDRIVLEDDGADGLRRRWSFNEIRPESFVWRGERSADGGKTWWLQAEYHMRRRT